MPCSWAAFKAARHHDDYVKEAYVEEMIENVLESKAADEKNQEVTTRKVVSKEYVDHALHGDKE